MKGIAAAGAVISLVGAAPAAGRNLTVDPRGDDSGPGTAARPWRTIQRAADRATPGSTVDIRAGVYRERVAVRVSGAPGRPIRFRGARGAVIDGEGLPPASGIAGLVRLASVHHVVVEGLELRGQHDPADRFVPAGVLVTGAAHDIVLRRLDVHDITTRSGDAHGIAVYGTSARAPIRNVRIDANRVHDLRLGSSEAVVVNGNVRRWAITRNHVFSNDNIGIDAIGFEGTAAARDRARDGLIAGNLVEDIDSLGNPAYDEDGGGNCRCAGGIYIDGGTRIRIERNVVLRSNIGLELASEHANGGTSHIVARNNLIAHSTSTGLAMGGYDRRRGPTSDARVINNTFLDNDTLRRGNGEVLLQYRVRDSVIANNVVVANDQGVLLSNPYAENARNTVDHNVWWVAGGAGIWQWRTRTHRGFLAYRAATGNDAHGRFADPRVDPAGTPRRASPVIDAGDDRVASGRRDLRGGRRRRGRRVDIGAVEARAGARTSTSRPTLRRRAARRRSR